MAWFLPIMGIYILSYVCIYLVIFFLYIHVRVPKCLVLFCRPVAEGA